MNNNFTEDTVEQACLGWLTELRDTLLPKLTSGKLHIEDVEIAL